MQKKIQSVLMRGGSSRGLFFHEAHLPKDEGCRTRIILAAYGSPDANCRQIDGVGGAVSTTSKVAIIDRSEDPKYDVTFRFGQVSIDRPVVDYNGNCGNMSSAVGPFAVDEGLVAAREPVTTVRIHQLNTDKMIIAEVPAANGRFDEAGNYAIAGVPGTGAKITLRFIDPGGSLTDALFPTGKLSEEWVVDGIGMVTVTVMDASNPVVFVGAASLGLTGIEINEIDQRQKILARLEAIRRHAAVICGLAKCPDAASQAVPKIAIVSPPAAYRTTRGDILEKKDLNLVARIMSMGYLHKAYSVSGAICTAGAAKIPGTVVHAVTSFYSRDSETVTLGHPGGTISIDVRMDLTLEAPLYREAVIHRTARRLMEGRVLVPESCFYN